MRLFFYLEYSGICKEALISYSSIFKNGMPKYRTFQEMPMANMLGITGDGLDMVWQSRFMIQYEEYCLGLEIADGLLIAMGRNNKFDKQDFQPVICIENENENYAKELFQKLYNNLNFDKAKKGEIADLYGIRWKYKKSNHNGIFYCLTFDGFCSDVISYYENAFQIKAIDVIHYANSPYAEMVLGANKIYSATLYFEQDGNRYALKLCDSLESAIHNKYGYDPTALLFYQHRYNPVFMLQSDNIEQMSDCFQRLSIGAKLNMPISEKNSNGINGSLIDKYGICWNFCLVS